MIFLARKEKEQNHKDSIYKNQNVYEEEPEEDLELDLAIKIFNDITDYNQNVSWVGFEIMMDLYDIENVKDFVEYIIIIKETINNFDKLYDNKINTPEVRRAKELIESLNKGKKNAVKI